MKSIRTSYDPKPIPSRKFDWTAVFDDYDLGSPIGYGATVTDAIADLMDQIEEEGDGKQCATGRSRRTHDQT